VSELPTYAAHEERAERSVFVLPLLAAALILALIGVIGVALDGGDGGTIEDPAALIRSAPDALEDAGSARMAMTMSMSGGGMSMDVGGEGLVDFVSGAATFEMSIMGQTMEMRTDGQTLWMKMPSIAMPEGATGSWVEVPVAAMPGVPSTGFPGASSDGYVEVLRGLSGDVEDLGTEEVDGVDTHHYRFDVDVEAALEQLPADERAELEGSFDQLGTTTFPIDLWITEDGLPIRQVMELDLGALAGGTMTMQLDLSDFGVAVDVEPPPAEEVISFEDHPELGEMFGAGTVS